MPHPNTTRPFGRTARVRFTAEVSRLSGQWKQSWNCLVRPPHPRKRSLGGRAKGLDYEEDDEDEDEDEPEAQASIAGLGAALSVFPQHQGQIVGQTECRQCFFRQPVKNPHRRQQDFCFEGRVFLSSSARSRFETSVPLLRQSCQSTIGLKCVVRISTTPNSVSASLVSVARVK